jgi:Skp family chaperone for outer membrane proteins
MNQFKMNSLNLKSSILKPLNKLSLLAIIFLISSSLFAQRSVRIGYIDTEYILENINEYSIANTQLDSKIVKWKSEIEGRLKSLDDERKKLNNERVLLTNELILEREEDLQIIETEIVDYQQKRFGPGGDLMIQKKQLMQPIQDQIFAAVQEIATSKEYDFIFDKSADVVMLYSADRYDISDRVLKTINRTSKRTQVENKKERKKAEKEPTVVTVDSGKSERQKLLDERKAERKALLDKKRQDQLKARENRKKELEAKKQKKSNTRIVEENESLSSEEINIESDGQSLNEKTLSPKEKRKKDLEARKKALKEKREKLNKERKSRVEAQRKKRDSIKNNK